jgi:DNA-binding MarR family transcriptional regulator
MPRGPGAAVEPPVTAVAHSRIAYSVGRLERAVRLQIGKATSRFGLTVAQYTALSVLHARGQLSNAQLAQGSFVSPQAMNEIVNAMAEKKLIARRPDPLHGRIVQISLSPKGEEVLGRCDAAVQKIEDEMLAQLSTAERSQFQAYLRACTAALEGRQSAAGDSA